MDNIGCDREGTYTEGREDDCRTSGRYRAVLDRRRSPNAKTEQGHVFIHSLDSRSGTVMVFAFGKRLHCPQKTPPTKNYLYTPGLRVNLRCPPSARPPMSRFRPYNLNQQMQGPSVLVLGAQELLRFLTNLQQSGSRSREEVDPYFMLFTTDADRALRIPLREAATYRTLYEGRPARLRNCKVMIRVFDRTHWFLVTTRYSDDGPRNHSIYETIGFSWNGPLTVKRLEKRGKCSPSGILSAEHHYAAVAAVERFVIQLDVDAVLTSQF